MSDYINGGVDSANANLINIKNDLATLRPLLKKLKALILGSFSTQSGSGGVVSTTIGADDVPVKSMLVTITPFQMGSGDPSPTNIRQIKGWTGCNILQTGKNIINGVTVGLTIANNNGEISGTPSASSTNSATDYLIRVANETYILSKDANVDSHNMLPTFYNIAGEYLGRGGGQSTNPRTLAFPAYNADGSTLTNRTTAALPIAYMRLRIYGSSDDPMVQTTIDSASLMIEQGSTKTTYEPYKERTYAFDWSGTAGTVYGGTFNPLTGKLIVKWVSKDLSVDTSWSEQTWSGKDANAHYFRGSGFGTRRYGGSTSDVYGVCDSYKWWGNGTTTTLHNLSNLEFGYQGTNTYVWIRDDAYTTAADFKTSLAGKHLVYELATPTEYTLTPAQIKTFLGWNNISADCGDISCEYRIDRTLFLDTL